MLYNLTYTLNLKTELRNREHIGGCQRSGMGEMRGRDQKLQISSLKYILWM